MLLQISFIDYRRPAIAPPSWTCIEPINTGLCVECLASAWQIAKLLVNVDLIILSTDRFSVTRRNSGHGTQLNDHLLELSSETM